ncbi:Calcium-binding protein 7 [Actinomortierella wolfii]|nr:Calcium-binding protein 7 [Actinomortierella wolfii]
MSDIELKEAFALFDPTNSGTIQPQAFQEALAANFSSGEGNESLQADRSLRRVARGVFGHSVLGAALGNEEFARTVKIPTQPLDYKAFAALVGPAFQRPETSDNAYTVLFKSINKDGTGNVSAAELKTALRAAGNNSLSEADIDEIIHEADVSGDGRINYEEFLKIMQKSEKKFKGEYVL